MKPSRLLWVVLVLLFTLPLSAGNENWITTLNLNDNLYISQLSLPGAHDAATKGVSIGECQTITIEQLWDAGIRVFDLRPTDAANCPIYHGALSTGVNLTQALTNITGRLHSYPNDFAIILMRNENDNGSTDNWKTRVTAIMSNFSDYVIPFNNNLRLGDVRGKVVVLSRDYFADGYSIGGWGGDATIYEVYPNNDGAFRFHVQDYYEVKNATSKQNVIKSLLDEARIQTSPNFMYINYTSGYEPNWLGIGDNEAIRTNAKKTNKCALDYINDNPGRTGIIMMDHAGSSTYYGPELVSAIISQNNRLASLNLSTLPDNTDYYLQNVETGLWLQGNTAKTTTSRDGWNTAANMGSYGRPFRIQNYAADGYTLNTQSGPNALGCNYGDASLLYLDGSIGPTKWKFTGTRDAAHITINWDRWLSVDENNRLVNSNPASTWRIWTRAERITAMASATPDLPQDVTWLMVNPELMNNDNRTPQWTINRSGGNQGWPDGFRPNRVFETWNFSSLDFYQTISGLPNGCYRVKAHAMYSPTGIGDTNINDYNEYVSRGNATVYAALYANGNEMKLPSIYSFVNATQIADYTYRNLGSGVNIVDGWWQIARAMGEDDKFLSDPLEVAVTDGSLRLGVKSLSGNPSSNWVVIGSFQLEYLGDAKEKFSVAISDAGYATFVAPFDATLPAGVTASTATIADNGTTIDLTPISGAVPAHTPVILSADATTVFNVEGYPTTVATPPTNGVLTGTYTDITAPVGSYVLQNQSGRVGFYRVEAGGASPRVRAHQAYLTTSPTTNVKAFLFEAGEDGIERVESPMANGQKIYNLAGQHVTNPRRGLYIVNGHKMMVK